MKKALLLSSLLLFLYSNSFAQDSYDTEIDFGLRAKYSIVSFSEIDKSEVKEQGGTFSSSGIAFGGYLQLRVNHWYFQPEIVYNRVTTKLGNELSGGAFTYGEFDFTFNSIEVPLLLGYRTSFGDDLALRIGAGVMASFLVNVKGDLVLEPGPQISSIPQEQLDLFNNLTFGTRFGVGVDIGPFLFDVMYEHSLSKVGEEISTITPVIAGKERSWLIGVGYKLIKVKR